MFFFLTIEQLRSYSRNSIESLEQWARLLIHRELLAEYGEDYFNAIDNNGEHVVKKEIRYKADEMIKEYPQRFHRPVDTLFMDEIIYFLCHPILYKKCFKQALDYVYPQGKEEAREFLCRIIPVRNALSHSNPIEFRQAERAVCYSNDFIDGIKQYYKDLGKERMWNVPTIIKLTDSLGNEIYQKSVGKECRIVNGIFRVGDLYSISVEVDSSFNRDDYTIVWLLNDSNKQEEFFNKDTFNISFDFSDISESWALTCEIISNKEWHKMGDCDDWIRLAASVMPPIEI